MYVCMYVCVVGQVLQKESDEAVKGREDQASVCKEQEVNLNKFQKEKERLEADLTCCEDNRKQLRVDLTSLLEQHEQLQADLTSCRSESDQLKSDLTYCEQQKAQLEVDLTCCQQHRDNLQEEVQAYKRAPTSTDAIISDLRQKIEVGQGMYVIRHFSNKGVPYFLKCTISVQYYFCIHV